MENPCKPNIDEKHYSYARSVDANIKNDTPKAEVRHIECGKNGFGFLSRGDDSPPPPPLLIMAPPPFSDLGKRAKDVFGKGYHFGLIKLDCKTKTATGVEFTSGGTSNQESGKIFGSLETKYKVKDYGITFSEKWTTDNTLGTEVTVQDQGLQGLKVSGNVDFEPQTGNKSGAVKLGFANDQVNFNSTSLFDANGPLVDASAVVGYQGWLAGAQTRFDVPNSKLAKNCIALGYSTTDFVLHTTVEFPDSNDGQEFGGSIYQKVRNNLEAAVQLSWSSGSNETKFGIGSKFDLDQDASLRAKVDNALLIGLGYQQRLREGVTLTLSVQVDGANFNSGGHKIGLALDLEA